MPESSARSFDFFADSFKALPLKPALLLLFRFSSNLQGAEPSKPPRGLGTSYAVLYHRALSGVRSQESSEGPRRPISPGCVSWKLELLLALHC